MAKCIKCGKENENNAKICSGCGANLTLPPNTSPSAPPKPQARVGNGAPPKEITTELIKFANALNLLAIFLALIIIVGGGVIAYNTSSAEQVSDFNYISFISTGCIHLVYAAIVYSVFEVMALLLRSLSVIVHNTRVTANCAEAQARREGK